MDAKKLLTITIVCICLLPLSGASMALAGPTSISGTMTCYMPTLLEMNDQNSTPSVSNTNNVAQAPTAVQEGMALRQTTVRGQASVITVCAK